MKLILMLVVVLIVGMLVMKQFKQGAVEQTQAVEKTGNSPVTVLPTSIENREKFKSEMSEFFQQEAQKRDLLLDRAPGQ